MSPDYAANFRGAQLSGLTSEYPESDYQEVLAKIRRKEIENILILGDRAINSVDIDDALVEGVRAAKNSVAVISVATSKLASAALFVVPGRTILEKSGLLVNRSMRLQYTQSVVPLRDNTMPEWRFLAMLAETAGMKLIPGDLKVMSDRDCTRWYLGADSSISSQGLTIQAIKNGGMQLSALSPAGGNQSAAGTSTSQGAPTPA